MPRNRDTYSQLQKCKRKKAVLNFTWRMQKMCPLKHELNEEGYSHLNAAFQLPEAAMMSQ